MVLEKKKPMFKTPKYHELEFQKNFNYITVTDEQLVELEKDYNEIQAYNRGAMDAWKKEYIAARDALLEFYADSNNAYRYIVNRPPTPLFPFYSFTDFQDRVKKAREEKKKKESQEEMEALRGRAIKYLVNKGFTYGKYFTFDNAIRVANEVAGKEAIDAKIAEMTENPTFIDFAGHNCDPDEGYCSGWDGVSNRCDCGHRRVNWVTGWNHTFEHPEIEAEAY